MIDLIFLYGIFWQDVIANSPYIQVEGLLITHK